MREEGKGLKYELERLSHQCVRFFKDICQNYSSQDLKKKPRKGFLSESFK